PPPPTPALFPYTTLFRSQVPRCARIERTDRPRAAPVTGSLHTPRPGVTREDTFPVRCKPTTTHSPRGEPANDVLHASGARGGRRDRKSTRLNSSHVSISY